MGAHTRQETFYDHGAARRIQTNVLSSQSNTEAHSHTRATRRSAHALLASRELARPVPHGTSPAPDARAPTRALKPQTAQSPKTPPPLALPSQIDRHQPRSTRTHTRPSTPPPPPHAATRRRHQTHAAARRTPPPRRLQRHETQIARLVLEGMLHVLEERLGAL